MRMWRYEPPSQDKPTHRQEYEVIGYVISGLQIPTQSVHVYRLEVVHGSDLIPSTLPN
jgi:hypothetical protein